MCHLVTGYTILQALQMVAVLGKNSETFTDFWFGAFPACEHSEGLLMSWILDVF